MNIYVETYKEGLLYDINMTSYEYNNLSPHLSHPLSLDFFLYVLLMCCFLSILLNVYFLFFPSNLPFIFILAHMMFQPAALVFSFTIGMAWPI